MRSPASAALLPRISRDVFVVLALCFLGLRLLQVPPWDQSVDAYAYWSTRDGISYEGAEAGELGAYLYSPAFAQVIRPLVILPWPLFVTIWTGFNIAILWWLLRSLALPSLLFLPIPLEIISGNVHLMYAAAIVIGFRAAWTWALPILTKVTPGIGLLWFAVRGERRSLLVSLGTVAVLTLISLAIDPEAWRSWLGVLTRSSSTPMTVGWTLGVPLAIRLPVACIVAVVAARRGHQALLPVAVTLALPVVWFNSFAVLAACVPLYLAARRVHREAADPTLLSASA